MTNVQMLVGVVVFIFILIALAPSVIDLADTRTCEQMVSNETGRDCGLENASAGQKAIYSLIPLFYAILGLGAVVAVLRFGKR